MMQTNTLVEKFSRNCPSCGNEILYASKYNKVKADTKNADCKSCSSTKNSSTEKEKLRRSNLLKTNNPNKGGIIWKGKKHSNKTIEIMENSHKKIWENPSEKMLNSMKDNFSKSWGENNPFYKGLPVLLLKKYGNDDGVRKWKQILSKTFSGELNPMYGVPSPLSGRGISGFYKGWYFRSSVELYYMINVIERFNLKWESAEKKMLKVHYDLNGIKRTYVADFLINNKYLVECKPKRLINTEIVKAKSKAAIEFCKENNLIFKLFSPKGFTKLEMLEMHGKGTIQIENRKLEWLNHS